MTLWLKISRLITYKWEEMIGFIGKDIHPKPICQFWIDLLHPLLIYLFNYNKQVHQNCGDRPNTWKGGGFSFLIPILLE